MDIFVRNNFCIFVLCVIIFVFRFSELHVSLDSFAVDNFCIVFLIRVLQWSITIKTVSVLLYQASSVNDQNNYLIAYKTYRVWQNVESRKERPYVLFHKFWFQKLYIFVLIILVGLLSLPERCRYKLNELIKYNFSNTS